MKIKISISEQTLKLIHAEKVLETYSISTGLKGAGCEKNSAQTPLGLHCIRAMIGKDEPINTVFVGRRKTGEIYNESLANSFPNRDWILSRIIWLSGCEKNKNRLGNVDTMQRYIYIHGTPDTEPMGIAKSHGCIRMHNKNLLALFDKVSIQTQVEIKA